MKFVSGMYYDRNFAIVKIFQKKSETKVVHPIYLKTPNRNEIFVMTFSLS